MKEIKLTQGRVALVDDDDYNALSQRRWYTHKIEKRRYAVSYLVGSSLRLRMHRLIMAALPGFYVDHINGDGLDNRKQNLRIATPAGNSMNTKKRKWFSSQYKGVSWNAKYSHWRAQIRAVGKKRHLGCFSNERLAALAYDAAARDLCPEFATLNFPQDGERGAL